MAIETLTAYDGVAGAIGMNLAETVFTCVAMSISGLTLVAVL